MFFNLKTKLIKSNLLFTLLDNQ